MDLKLAKEVVAAADALLDRRLWLRFANEQLVLLAKDGWPHPVVATIMGAARQEFGVMFLQGATALADMRRVIRGHRPAADMTSVMLSVSLERMAEMEEEFTRILRAVGRQGRHVPELMVKEPGKFVRAPRKAEQQLLLELMRGLLAADDGGQLEPIGSIDSVLPCVRLPRVASEERVSVELVRPGNGEAEMRTVAAPALPEDVLGLPRSSARYLVGVPVLPAQVGDDDQELRALVVLEAGGPALACEPMQGFDLNEVASKLFALLRGELHAPPGLPAEMLFLSRTVYDHLGHAFAAAGVKCDHAERIAELEAVIEQLGEVVEAGELPDLDSVGAFGAGDIDLTTLPAADDLDRWKGLDMFASQLVLHRGLPRAMAAEKAWRRYFGEERDESSLQPKEYATMKIGAFVSWYVLHHTVTRRSKPMVEKLLGEAPAAVAHMLTTQRAATPALWRVEAIEVGEGIDAVDVTSGRRVRITDHGLSTSARVGMLFVARVYAAGDFHFASVAGPVMPPEVGAEAGEFLERELGLRLDQPVADDRMHLFGRLWGWSEERQDALSAIALQNTDGDALRWHTATFTVGDAAAFATALAARDDVEEDEPGARWRWFKPGTLPEERVSLGTIELLGDSAVLDVNSRQRFERARAWLEVIPGVKLASFTEKEVDPRKMRRGRPLDDAVPPPSALTDLPPEALAQVQEHLRRHYFAWLDESIPALGGKTPRAACRTEEGRRTVARMIRTYPDPGGIPGMKVPREEMLRELGLEGEA